MTEEYLDKSLPALMIFPLSNREMGRPARRLSAEARSAQAGSSACRPKREARRLKSEGGGEGGGTWNERDIEFINSSVNPGGAEL
jgi:hypothetical protein